MVIAHELAHIQRLDPFVNVFQVCVETLLFYHPAVWWLNTAHSRGARALLRRHGGRALRQRRRIRARAHADGRMAQRTGLGDGRQPRSADRAHRPRAWPEDSRRRNARHRTHGQRPLPDRCTRRRKCTAGNAHPPLAHASSSAQATPKPVSNSVATAGFAEHSDSKALRRAERHSSVDLRPPTSMP